jgi:hypothetical protein
MAGVDHAAQHANANDAIEAIEAIIGVTGSTVAGTIEKRLSVALFGTQNGSTGGIALSYAGNNDALPYAQLNTHYAGGKVTFVAGTNSGSSCALSGAITTPGGTDIVIGSAGKAFFESASSNISGSGHLVGALGWATVNASGRTAGLVIGNEGKIDVAAGTVTTGVISESQLSSNAGTITTLIGQRSTIVANSGTVSYFVGNYFPDHSAISGVTAKRCYQSDDANAPMQVKSAIISQALYSVVPTTGQNITIPDNYTEYLILPAGTLATLTVTFPANPIDGQEISFKTTQTITALTMAGNGKSIIDPITTLAALGYCTYRYLAASTSWYRKG